MQELSVRLTADPSELLRAFGTVREAFAQVQRETGRFGAAAQRAGEEATTAVQKSIAALVGLDAPMRSAAESAESFMEAFRAGDAVARLQASLDPGIAALQRYERAQEDVARAVALGTMSQEEANRTLALARARYEAAGQAALASGQHIGQSLQITGYQVQNLAFQFQDIGVMLASGQSPLLLAVQQGSQIAQMLGPMGAGGALRALAQGFMAFLNPMTLVTIGSIAAGAAMIQWLTGAGEKAETLEDKLKGLTEAVDAYRAAVGATNRSDIDLMDDFGANVDAARELLAIQREIARLRAEQQIAAVAQRLADRPGLDGLAPGDVRTLGARRQQLEAARDALGARMAAGGIGEMAMLQPQMERIQQEIEALGAIVGTLREMEGQLDLSAREAEALAEALAGLDEAQAQGIDDYIAKLREALSIIRDSVGPGEKLNLSAQALTDDLSQALQGTLALKAVEEADLGRAQARLQALRDESEISRLIVEHGRDSAEVAAARAAQERRAFVALVETWTISAEMRSELVAAYDAAKGLADAAASARPPMENLAATAAEIARLAAERDRLGSLLPDAASPAEAQRIADDIAAIEARIGELGASSVSAREEVDALLGETETLIGVLEQAPDNPFLDALQAVAERLRDRLKEARDNTDALNAADVSGLRTALETVAGIVDRILGGLGLTRQALEGFKPGSLAALSGTPSGDYQRDLVAAATQLAQQRGVSVEDLLTVIGFETAGTFSGAKLGPRTQWGQHVGLIQMGEPQRARFGYDPLSGNAFEHMAAVDRYFQAHGGLRPGDDLAQIYSMVLTGGRNNFSLGDTHNGGVVSSVWEATRPGGQIDRHRPAARELLQLYGADAERFAEGRRALDEALARRMGEAIDRGEADRLRAANEQLAARDRILQGLMTNEERWAAQVAEADRLREAGLLSAEQHAARLAQIEGERAAEAERAASQSAAAQDAEARALQATRDAYEGLVASMDPWEAAQQAFAQGQRVLDEALRAGTITAAEYDATLARLLDRLSGEQVAIATQAIIQGISEADAALAEAVRASREALSSGITGGFRTFFADLITGAQSAGEAFRALGATILDTFARILAERFTERFVAPLADALAALVFPASGGMILPGFAKGGVVAGDDIVPFARGGVPGEAAGAIALPPLAAFSGRIVDQPTLFGLGSGRKTGLMGEAGAEAILPLVHDGARGVGAVGPDGAETVLPLARLASGRLGVALAAFATGGVPDRPDMEPAILSGPAGVMRLPRRDETTRPQPPAEGAAVAALVSALRDGLRQSSPIVNIHNAPPGTRAEPRVEGGQTMLDILIPTVQGAVVDDLRRGGPVAQALADRFGLARQGR